MQFHQSTAEVFVPDNLPAEQALKRTTHLAIGAHPDDLEIMAAWPILECFQQDEKWFTGVVLTDGRGSPRGGIYKDYSNDEMRMMRLSEQKKAAVIGGYAAMIWLDYPSEVIKERVAREPIKDISEILQITNPQYVFTHNLADKHDTHVSTALRVISAILDLPEAQRPKKLFGCESWRDLDWMVDTDKVIFDLSTHENLQAELLGCFESQIYGGKRYDLANLGRRRANATYLEPGKVDFSTGLSFAMNLTELIHSPQKGITQLMIEHIERFEQDVINRLIRFS